MIYSTAGGKVSPCLTVSHGIPQITTGDIVSRQFCGNHPCLKISVIIPGRQPCPMVITEIFRNGPYYHGTQYVPWEFVGHRGIPWDTGNFTTGSTVHNMPMVQVIFRCILVGLQKGLSTFNSFKNQFHCINCYLFKINPLKTSPEHTPAWVYGKCVVLQN